MTIQEAIKSEKPFRRASCFPFMTLIILDGYICWEENKEKAILPAKDFLKDDWVISEDENQGELL